MPGSVIAYTGNDVAINNILLNTIDAGCIWTVSDIDGWWGLPEATAPDSPRSVYEDGSTPVAGRYLSRKLKLTGTIVPTEPNTDGQAFSVAARNAFNRALNLIRTQGVLQVNGDPAKMANVQIVDRPLTNMSKQNDVLNFEINLRASDPRKYSISESFDSTTAYLGNIGRTYDKVYDYTYGAAGSSGLINAYNEGTYNTFGKIVIHGPIVNPQIEHLSSNSRLAFEIELAVGQSLEIDLAVHTVTLNGGANRRTSLLPISKWFALQPGDNYIKFSGTQDPLPQEATDDRTNLIVAPNATSGTTQGWVMRVPGDSLTVTTLAGAPGNNVYLAGSAVHYSNPNWGFETATTARPPVTEFDIYAFSLNIRQRNLSASPAYPDLLSANITYYDLNGISIKTHESTAWAVPSDRWLRISTVSQAPSGAVKASVFVRPTQYQHDLPNALNTTGYYFDDVMFEKVVSQDDLRKQIATNGNLNAGLGGWTSTDPGNSAISSFDRTWFLLDGAPSDYRDAEKEVSDWYVRQFNENHSAVNRYGYQYVISTGFEVGEEYTFSGNVRSTIDQNWAVKVQALTSTSTIITGGDGSKYITQGTSTYVGADEWQRISSVAVVPSGTASLRVILEPANGGIYAVNAVTNPGFERVADDETAFSAFTMSDDFGQYPYGRELIKNYAVYPDTKGVGVFPNYWSVGSFGTAGAGTLTSVSTGGYLNGYAARKAWTTAPSSPATQADLGILYTVTPNVGYSNSTRPPTSIRAWVTASRTTNQQIAIEFINALSTTVSTWVSPPVSIGTVGGWIIAENINTSALNWVTMRIHIGPYAAGFTPVIGDYITASGLMIEYSPTSHVYFSGSATDTWDKRFEYDSVPGGPTTVNSTSQIKYRENLAYNPRPTTSSTYWGYQNGTGGAATLSTVTSEIGPTDQYGFRRATITTIDTAGAEQGHTYTQDGTFAGVIGDKHMSSIWVRYSSAASVTLRVAYRLAGATSGTAYTGTPVSVPANVWTRLSVESTATAAYDGIFLRTFETAAGPAVGQTIDATGVLIERNTRVDNVTNLVNDPSFEVSTGSSVVATNMYIDPEALTTSQFESNVGFIDLSNITGFNLSPSATRGTRMSASPGRMGVILGTALPTSTQYTLLLTVRASTTLTSVAVHHRPTITSTSNQVTWGTITIPAGVSQIRITGNTSASAPSSTAGITFVWSTGSVGSTLDMTDIVVVAGTYTGPYFDGDTPPINFINKATNPGMEATSGSVETRRNYVTHPTSTTYVTTTGTNLGWNNTRWFGGGVNAGTYTNVTGATDGPEPGITSYARKTWTAVSGTTVGDVGFGTNNWTGMTLGAVYTVTGWMRTSIAGRTGAGFDVSWNDASGGVSRTNLASLAITAPNVWQRFSGTFTVPPAGITNGSFILDTDSGTAPSVGSTIDVTGLVVEQAGTVGTVQRTNLHNNPVVGRNTTNYSVSVVGITPTNTRETAYTGTTNTPPTATTTWYKSVWPTAPTSSPATVNITGTGTGGIPVTTGLAYTFTAYAVSTYTGFSAVRLDVGWYNAAGTFLSSDTTTQSALAVAGQWERRSKTLTAPATAAFASIGVAFSGPTAAPVNTYVGVTAAMVEQAASFTTYFDGSTIGTVNNDYDWTGTPHNSSSVVRTAPTGIIKPYFDGLVQPALRINLHPQPGTTSNSLVGVSNLTTQTAGTEADLPFTGTTFRRLTAGPTPSIGDGFDSSGSISSAPVIRQPGTYVYSTWVRASHAVTMRPTVIHSAAAGGTVTSAPDVALVPGVWTRVNVTANLVSPGALGFRLRNITGGGTIPTGGTLDIGGFLCEMTSDATLPYFDGSTVQPNGFTASWYGTVGSSPSYIWDADLPSSWTGTAYASASILSAPGTTGVTSNGVYAIGSTQWAASGSKSLRQITRSTTGDSFNVIAANTAGGGGSSGIGLLELGKTYTVIATLRQDAPLTGPAHGNGSRQIVVAGTAPWSTQRSTQGLNAAGVYEHRITFSVVSANYGQVRLYHGHRMLQDQPDVWWDNVAVVEGDYSGTYFDGSNGVLGLTPKWTSTPNASESFVYNTETYDSSWTPAWTGTVKASTSTLTSPNSNAASSVTNAQALYSTIWSSVGAGSLRIRPTGASNDSYAVIATDAASRMLAGIAAKKLENDYDNVYSIRATLRRGVDATGPFNSNSSNVYVVYTRTSTGATQYFESLYNVTDPSDAGVHSLARKLYFWEDTSSIELRVYNGTSLGKGDLWVDAFSVVEGPYVDDSDPILYFDGSSSSASGFSYAWNGATNASTSVRYLPVSPTLQPYFDGDTSDTKELFRNLVTYPNPQATTGWTVQVGTGGAASLAYNSGAGVAANGFVRGTWTTGTTTPSTGAVLVGAGQTTKPVPASTALSAGIWVRPSVDLNFYLQVNFYNTSGSYISSPPFGPTTFAPANKWTLVKAENFTSPAATYAAAMYAVVSSNIATGTTIDADQAMLVVSPTLPAYFDGTVTNMPGTTGAWLGTAYASQSALRGTGDANFWWNTGAPATESSVMTYPVADIDATYLKTKGLIAVGSTEYQQNARQGSLRLVPTSDSTDSYVDLHSGDEILPSLGGKAYTLFATVVVDKIQTGTLSPSARRFAWMSVSDDDSLAPAQVMAVSDAVPNLPGRYAIKWTTTVSTGTLDHIRFYNGASKGNGDIWLERFSIVSGDSYNEADPYYATNMGVEFDQISDNQRNTFIRRTGVAEIYRNNVENPEFRYLGSSEPNVTRINMLSDPRGTVNTLQSENGWTTPYIYPGNALTLSAQKADGPEGRQEFWRLSNTPGVDPQLIDSTFVEPSIQLKNYSFQVGEIYTFSVFVRAALGATVGLRATLSAPTANNTQVESTLQTIAPNTWTRLFVTFMVEEPFDSSGNLPKDFDGRILIDPSSNSATQTYDYGSAMLEKTSRLLPYFDGGLETNVSYIRGYQGAVTGSPSIEVQTGVAALRQNLLQSPTTYGQIGDAAATTQWQSFGSAGGTAAFGFKPGIADQVLIFSAAGTGSNGLFISTRKTADPAVPVVPLTEYAFSADTVSTVPLAGGSRVDIQWLDKNNTLISTALGTATAISVTGTYQRRSILAVSPSGAVFARPLITFPTAGSSMVVGSAAGGTNALFERANYIDTFFSGSSAVSGSLNTVAWNGVRNASSSSLIDARKIAVRTNYAVEAIPLSTSSTRWTFTPGGGVYSKAVTTDTGMNDIPGIYTAQVTTTPSMAPYVWSYSEKINGVAGDIFTGSMAYRAEASNTIGDVYSTLTYKLLGATVNSASAVLNADHVVWRQLFTPAVAAAGAYDEIVVSLTTAVGYNLLDRSYVTQALIEKTSQQLPWFNTQYADQSYARINRNPNPSYEMGEINYGQNVDNRAANSGPFGTLVGTGTWAALPPLGATVNTQMIQSAGDTHPHASPNYVRSVYATAASSTGDKGIEYVNGYGSSQFGTGAFHVEMYVRSSVALPARLLITSETGVSTVVSTSVANSGINLVPNQWTRLYGTVTAPGTHTKVRVKALLGSASTSLPVGTVFDVSSVLITGTNIAALREYNDKSLPDSDFRDYKVNPVHTQASLYRNPYTWWLQKNLVLDPTVQYGGADWMLTPGWGTGGTGTRTIELGKGLGEGYSLMRRWTATPSDSATLGQIGGGYLFKAAVTGRPYSFTALYSASKASSAAAWVTWYTDATLSSVVSTTLLSSVAYETSGTGVFLTGEGVIAPATAGFGLFTVGAYSAGFNPQAGDWMSISNMRIDEGSFLAGEYFDVNTFTGTDFRYQIDGVPGQARTVEAGIISRSLAQYLATPVTDKSWALSGLRSLRLVALQTSSNNSEVELLNADEDRLFDSAPYPRTITVTGTVRTGPQGHRGAFSANPRSIGISYYHLAATTNIFSTSASPTANTVERLSVTATIPANATNIMVILRNGGYYGNGDVWFDDVMVEEGSEVRDYFDGSTDNAPAGQTTAWLGEPNKSYSVMRNLVSDYVGASSTQGSHLVGTKPYTVEPFDGYAATQSLRGAAESASAFVRVANFTTTSNDVYATVGGAGGGMRLGMQAGRTYTALGTVMLETVQTGTLHANARTITVYYKTASSPGAYQSFVSAQAPNATGSFSVRNIFTLPTDTTEAFLALYSGSANGQDRLYWTNVALVPYAYTGPYFSGHSAAWAAGETPVWYGAVDASVSAVTGAYPANVYAYNSHVVQSTSWSASGAHSLKIIPISSEESYAVVRDPLLGDNSWGSPYLPTTATTPRAIKAVIHVEEAQVGTLSQYARSIVAVNSTTGAVSALAQAPNVPGTYELSATLPGNYALREIRLYNGSTGVSGVPVWWDNFGVFYVPDGMTVPGTPAYTGPYFDGDTPESDSGTSYSWIDDNDSSPSMAAAPGAGLIWPSTAIYYADKISAISGAVSSRSNIEYFDGRTAPTTDEVYYYTGSDDASITYARTTKKPAVDSYFDGNTGGAHWNGPVNGSSSTLPGLPMIPEAVMDITYRSAWIE